MTTPLTKAQLTSTVLNTVEGGRVLEVVSRASTLFEAESAAARMQAGDLATERGFDRYGYGSVRTTREGPERWATEYRYKDELPQFAQVGGADD